MFDIIRRNLQQTCCVILPATRLQLGRSILGMNCALIFLPIADSN